MSEVTELYDRDFYAWTQDQAAALRAWPGGARPNALDIAHLAEEIEDLGSAQRNAAKSLLRQLILHLLKLRFHPDARAVRHWRSEVVNYRVQIEDVFADSPSLKARRADLAEPAWRQALRLLRADPDIADDSEAIAALTACTATPPYLDLDREVLDPDWFPARA